MLCRFLLTLVLLTGCDQPGVDAVPETLKVMVFNAWGAGANSGESTGDAVDVIRRVDPDIVGLLETRRESESCAFDVCPPAGPSVAADIAAQLGYHVYDQLGHDDGLWANAILSRYPIVAVTPNELGVVVAIGARQVAVFNIHLADFPYQPYQLLGIPYGSAPFLDNEAEAIESAVAARGRAIDLLADDVQSLPEIDTMFLLGDFNEPSHRDWSERAVDIGRHPLRVSYPSARRLEGMGFVDAYRAVYPDEIARPGFTWTPSAAADAAGEHHDRIDYVFVRSSTAAIESAAVVGEKTPEADIVITPWPSDHRAVVITVRL